MAELTNFNSAGTENGKAAPGQAKLPPLDNGQNRTNLNKTVPLGRIGDPANAQSTSGKADNGSLESNADGEAGDGKKKEEKPQMVGFFEVFRFSDGLDRLFMIVGSICAAANGVALPAMIIVFGDMIDLFVDTGIYTEFLDEIGQFLTSVNETKESMLADSSKLQGYCGQISTFYNGTKTCPNDYITDKILDEMTTFAIYYVIIGVVVTVCGYVQVVTWMTASERQSHRIRNRFLYNVLRQDIGWFDTHETGELNTRLADDILKIHDGIGDKVATLIQWNCGALAGFIIGFYYGWKLTLVILAVSPLLVVSAALFGKLAASMTTKELAAYAKAGAVAEEVFSSIRTVVAFGGQEKEAQRYKNNLGEAKTFGVRKGFTTGLSMGFVWFVIFGSYALGFWYGGKLTRDEPDNYTVGKMLIVFFSVLIGAFSLGNASPSLQSMAAARGAAYVIFQLIDLKSKIDNMMEGGKRPSGVTGTLSFHNVHFFYPSRPETKVLDGLSLTVNPGKTVALVGSSGCGKSTTVQLLQRFYDPLEGQVKLDGEDIKDLNVRWLRSHIGVVSQEPVLFATTIAENIRYGCEGVTEQDVIEAAKNANAHDFIMSLPEKYETLVGERGAQLSGGQKQRVAIARALVRNPKILLLDEATSALDTESEKIVQDALDKARQGRTTIVIAHRLSTIKTADIIISFKDGKVFEQGTHDELMAKQGIYYQLVMNQTNRSAADDEEEEEIEKFTQKGAPDSTRRQLSRALSNEGEKPQRARGTSESEKTEEKKDEKEELPNAPFTRLMRMNSPEWVYILLGCIAAILNGGVQPSFAVIFSKIIGVFAETDLDKQEKDIMMYCLLLIGLAFVSLVSMFMQSYFFAVSGENLTVRVRDLTFRAMLHQEISFYDDKSNTTGALTTRLATDASLVQGATGSRLGMFIMNFANIGTGLIIAFIYGWQLTLLIIGFLPLIVLGGFLQIRILAGVAGSNKAALEEAGKTATEAIENMRTVVALGREVTMHERFMEHLRGPYNAALKKGHIVGFAFGFSQGCIYFVYASAFMLGAYLIEESEMDFEDVFLVFSAIVFGAMALGNASAFAPDAGKAQVSAQRIIKLIDNVPSINSQSTEGRTLPNGFRSEVVFKDVEFHYPSRPDAKILQKLNITVQQGQTVALVGSSGCGKSTTVQLIERFYDAEEGSVTLGGCSVKELNLQHLRAQIGIVSQEPVLFDRSLAENIAYGDNERVVSMDEIIAAARAANIHEFIAALPNGYDTPAGDKGAQLSGGQKQRVAIARALVRNPRVLLLDEATSALDTESERIVQEALDKAREGRTCIVIAHRLSTITNADKICVIRHGVVTEEGTHNELMNLQGFYYKLNMAQARQK
ncbi:ATP-dependent translocase ABCB1-like isoform X2 [Babylonia areolata]|uniref:ATP-dependent translocase ABCB1-like isoform X2 n=1 Tax=Babylonia areolata TaxID=304850 RepID=UPI003FD1EFBB